MSSIGTGYDLSTSTFSPDGRVFQVDYAQKAVESSGTAIAIRGKDGVVFAVEKIITSKLYEKSANRRIFSVDRHVGMAGSGLYADVRQLGKKLIFDSLILSPTFVYFCPFLSVFLSLDLVD